MTDLSHKLLSRLENAEKIVFMGIGEEKLSDDGVGPYIISELLPLSNEKFLFINAGIDPMTRIDEIIEFFPTHLVIIDTCTLNEPPGTVAIIERNNISDYMPISSHTIPIHIVIDLICEKLTRLQVFIIGFVPESLEGFTDLKLFKEDPIVHNDFNENYPFFEIRLTDTIKKVADQVIKIIKKILKKLD